MNSYICLCQKYHNDILNMLPSFDLIMTANSQLENNQSSALRNLQNACAEENKWHKIVEMHVQLWRIIENDRVHIFQ